MKKIISVVTVASTLGSSLISGVTPSLAEDDVNNNEATLENEYVEKNVNEIDNIDEQNNSIYIYGTPVENEFVIPEEGMWVWDTDTHPKEPVGFKVPLTIYYMHNLTTYKLHKEVIEYEPGAPEDFRSEYGNKVFENYELAGDYGVILHVNKDGVYDEAQIVFYYDFVGENEEDLPEYDRLPLWNTYIDSTTGDIIKSEIGEGIFQTHEAGYGDQSDWYLYQGALPEGYIYVEHSGRFEFEYDENDNIIKALLVVDVMPVASESDLKTYTVTYWNVDSLNSEPIMAIDMQLDLRRINDVSYIEKATAQYGTGWDYYVYQSHKVDGDTIHVYYKEVILPTEGTVEFKVNYRDEKAGVIIERDTIKLDASKLNDDSYIEEALKAHLVDSGYTYMAENYVYQNYTISYKDMSIDAVFNLDLGEDEEAEVGEPEIPKQETIAEKEIIVTGLRTGAIGLAIGAAFVSIGWKVNNKRGK